MDNETTVDTEGQAPATSGETTTPGKQRTPRKRSAKKAPAKKAPAKKSTARKMDEPPRAAASSKLVILFRHGMAEDPLPDKTDAERSLTTDGHDRTKRSARGLVKLVSKVDAICASPMLRALQTALWVTKAYDGKARIQTSDSLLPDAPAEDVRRLIAETDATRIVLVGHEPNLTRCMADLLGVSELRVNLRRAGCVGIHLDPSGRGTLEWMLAPRTLRGL